MKVILLARKFSQLNLGIAIVALVSSTALADALVPATSEDIDQFDHQIAAQKQPAGETRVQQADGGKVGRPDNFGRTVSAEAHRMNAEGAGGKRQFGQFVNSQNPAAAQTKSSREDGASSAVSGTTRDRGTARGRDKKHR